MQLSENEIECIKFFPRSENLLSIYLFDYFEMNIFRRTGLSKKQLGDNPRINYQTHEVLMNDYIKNIGKDFLVIDSERYMKFSVWFFDDIGYEIYVNKDNCGENRLHFMNNFYYDKIMISDSQTEKLLDPANFKEIKDNLSLYMNLYRRFQIFRNSVACFLLPSFQKHGYGGYFLNNSKSDSYYAKNKGGLIYVYGKQSRKPEGLISIAHKKNILIPFENFVPVLNGIIENLK